MTLRRGGWDGMKSDLCVACDGAGFFVQCGFPNRETERMLHVNEGLPFLNVLSGMSISIMSINMEWIQTFKVTGSNEPASLNASSRASARRRFGSSESDSSSLGVSAGSGVSPSSSSSTAAAWYLGLALETLVLRAWACR